MRILIAAHGFPPTHSSGAERRAERTARSLAAHGHQVEVVAVEQIDSPMRRLDSKLEGFLLVHRLHYSLDDTDNRFRAGYAHPWVAEQLQKLLREGKFDVVHLISGYLIGADAIYLAHQFGAAAVVTLTEYWFMCARMNLIQITGKVCSGPETDEKCARCMKEDLRRFRLPALYAPDLAAAFWSLGGMHLVGHDKIQDIRLRREWLKPALEAADVVICPSKFLYDTFARHHFRTDHFRVMRQGLVLPEQLPERTASEAALRLCYIGQIKYHKGIDLLLKAVIQLFDQGYNLLLDLWGDDQQDPEYSAQLKHLSDGHPAVYWNGRFVGPRVWEILAESDVLVIPSRWYENSPNVILEANHARVPVIATNLGGMAELVSHQADGLLFELNDADDLARQIQRLIDEPDLLPRLQAGINPVKTLKVEVDQLVQQYEEAIQRRRSNV
jgi:glycosyltransferase involved in cell wall biosynthesis